jgi:exosortase J
LLALAGSLSLLPLWQNLLHIWLSDPLRSIGFSFPFFALAGIISAWRRCGRPLDGRPWALLLIALSIPLSRIVVESTLLLGSWFGLLHPGPVLFLYAAGAILLFAGPRLLRAAASPLCLLLCIDPVPRFFNGLVDLPLQRFSADVARSFSHLIGLHPTGDQLRMMFAPHFGMMIVPGCNGVRGSVTLFYLCLIFGYSRRLRPAACAAIALCGFVLGYALNLLRLCGLVLYYRIGVTWPVLQKHGTGLDYIIGCIIFLAATLALGVLIRLMEPTSLAPPAAAPLPRASTRKTTVSALLFAALTLAFIIPALRSVTAAPILPPSEATVLASFPSAVGPYHLVGTRSEFDPNGQFTLALADYAPDAPAAAHITLGIWIGSGNHFVAKSKFLQGILPQFTGSFDASAPGPLPVHLVTSLYDDGIAATYDAETACSPTACSDYMALAGRRGIILFPSLADLALQPRGTRLPILLRREWPSTTAPDSAHQRALFESDAHTFISHLDLHHLLQQDGTLP